MKKTKLFSALSLAAVALSVLPYATAFAATDGGAVGSVGDGGTSAGTSATDGAPASGTGQFGVGFIAGNLTLNQVPNFDFGQHTIGQTDAYNLREKGATPAPGDGTTKAATLGRQLVVTDQRDARDPWNVTVGVGSSIALVGAELALTVSAGNIQYGSWAGDDKTAEEFGGRYFSGSAGSQSTAGLQADNVTKLDLTKAGGAQKVFSVNDGTKVDPGTYALDFTDQATASISVPLSDQKNGDFTGTLVWTLSTAKA